MAEELPVIRPPLATPDQVHIESRAIALLARTDVQGICRRAAQHWIDALSPNPEHRSCFEAEFEQAAFCGLMNAVNADPTRPRIHAFGRFAHNLGGHSVPATKSGHPNPDYIYRFMALEGGARYILRGRVSGQMPTAVEIGMLTAEQFYQHNISRRALVIAADGHFTITIDPDPAGGRANHFRSTPETRQLLMRDVIGDLSQQRPLEIWVESVEPASAALPDSDDAIAASCEVHIRKHIDDLIWVYNQLIIKASPNHFETPAIHKSGVYGVSQASCAVNFDLAEENAFVITLGLGNAAYAVVPVSNYWGGVGRSLDRQVTLGTGRARPDPDGRYTFVVSHSDPGVPNWVDPAGLHQGVLFLRWVGFDPADQRLPTLDARHLDLRQVDALLAEGTPRLSAADRQAQLARRRRDYLGVMS
ncbi:MAG: hypothetical protein ABIO85_03770 [Sphingomicrobium sp.]